MIGVPMKNLKLLWVRSTLARF